MNFDCLSLLQSFSLRLMGRACQSHYKQDIHALRVAHTEDIEPMLEMNDGKSNTFVSIFSLEIGNVFEHLCGWYLLFRVLG